MAAEQFSASTITNNRNLNGRQRTFAPQATDEPAEIEPLIHPLDQPDNPQFNAEKKQFRRRQLLLIAGFGICLIAVVFQLAKYQLFETDSLTAAAESQYYKSYQVTGMRGRIYTADGALLVGNHDDYRLFLDNNFYQSNLKKNKKQYLTQVLGLSASQAEEQTKQSLLTPEELSQSYLSLAEQLAPILQTKYPEVATEAMQISLSQRLINDQNKDLITLDQRVNTSLKNQIELIGNDALAFDPISVRSYPEASLAAQIVGYVAKNDQGIDTGYAGIEGYLNKELGARVGQKRVVVDASSNPLAFPSDLNMAAANGRDVHLTIRRDVQNYLEEALQAGLEKYDADRGEIIVMEPKTGKILGWATLPSYDPANFNLAEPQRLHNPSLTQQFEPGSIFKVITVAAGIDSGRITPNTPCPNCHQARTIAGYKIRNWNDTYNPGITMTDGLAKSDNTAMMFIADTLGSDLFLTYLEKFKIGEPIGFEMLEDREISLPTKWGPVEIANRSFGQGIAVNSMQMVRAVGAIANHGEMMQPRIIDQVSDPETGERYSFEPVSHGQVITPNSAKTVTEMMVEAAKHGEAQWVYKNSDLVAGKTGTAQVPDEVYGGYKDDETLATFIGFAPANDPAFVMLVKIENPKSSPWAAETAAPLWNNVANRLFLLLGIDAELENKG